jgi:hypothetical protein
VSQIEVRFNSPPSSFLLFLTFPASSIYATFLYHQQQSSNAMSVKALLNYVLEEVAIDGEQGMLFSPPIATSFGKRRG